MTIHDQMENIIMLLDAGVIIPRDPEHYHFIVMDEDGGHIRTARNTGSGWFIQLH